MSILKVARRRAILARKSKIGASSPREKVAGEDRGGKVGGPTWECSRRKGRWRHELVGGLVRAAEALLTWQTRAAERSQLAAMDDRLLRDVGLSRSDVERERIKPFWTA